MGKKKEASGLGKALKHQQYRLKHKTGNAFGGYENYEYADPQPLDGAVQMASTVEPHDLASLLMDAELADRDFTAERGNVQIVGSILGSSIITKHELQEIPEEFKKDVHIPRRPAWSFEMTPKELEQHERTTFLEWRRRLAELEANPSITLTPFERNLDIWRQLWRVVERCQLVVQIVDARNPLLFMSSDLNQMVKDSSPSKVNVLLLNKADLLPLDVREKWAEYLRGQGLNFIFFSALDESLAQKKMEPEQEQIPEGDEDESEDDDEEEEEEEEKTTTTATENTPTTDAKTATPAEVPPTVETTPTTETKATASSKGQSAEEAANEFLRKKENEASSAAADKDEINTAAVWSSERLFDYFLEIGATIEQPDASEIRSDPGGIGDRLAVGMVGYPNVGKSSVINALCGSKRVRVGATPGKTKHLQTILLSSEICLCDCPGLVFPSLVSSASEMVCNGILPIDQMRDYRPSATLLSQRIPRHVLNCTYGLAIPKPLHDPKSEFSHVDDMLQAYGRFRGYMNSHGQPDESRAARELLKDYVKGKLLYAHLPPTSQVPLSQAPNQAAGQWVPNAAMEDTTSRKYNVAAKAAAKDASSDPAFDYVMESEETAPSTRPVMAHVKGRKVPKKFARDFVRVKGQYHSPVPLK